MKNFFRALSSLIFCFATLPTVAAGKRVALVIGNSAYRHASELPNPRNDAADMATTLRGLGVEVISGTDLGKAETDTKIRDFANALSGADAGIFFYAGHGLQVGGVNYLVPVDAKLESPAALDFEMVRLDLIQRTMERETKTNIIFLDACRDNPLARSLARSMGTRSVEIGRGLAAAESGVGTLISFSTQPGNVALDGTGRNSPFAGALLHRISTPGDTITDTLINVRNDVIGVTNGKQVPWEHSALTGRFYFRPGAGAQGTAAPALPTASPNAPEKNPTAVEPARQTPANCDGVRVPVGLEGEKICVKPGAGTSFRDCWGRSGDTACGPEMIVIPAGSFDMGSPPSEGGHSADEAPQHKVTISKPFAVGKFEVTFAEWEACVEGGGCQGNTVPSDQGWGKGNRPVINLSWNDAKEYVSWLSQRSDKDYRLLSEAEWEYAARAGSATRYAFGNTVTRQQAQFSDVVPGSAGMTVEVGSLTPNAFGLHDMHGNAREWVEDCHQNTYEAAPADGTAQTRGNCEVRAIRGGGWRAVSKLLRSANRDWSERDKRFDTNGLRVARTIAE